MEELKKIIKQLEAVTLLEYHNKNWLGSANERNRMKRNHLNQMLYIIEKMEEPEDDLPF